MSRRAAREAANDDGDDGDGPAGDDFESKVNMLTEKRGADREAALLFLCKELAGSFSYDRLSSCAFSVAEALRRSLQRGGDRERELASRLLCEVVITLGAAESEAIFKDFEPLLRESIRDPKRAAAVKVANVSALVAVCFVGASDAKDTERCLALLAELWGEAANSPPELIAAALRGWGLLLSTSKPGRIRDDVLPEAVVRLVALLDHENVDVRVNAGEDVVLLFEFARTIDLEELDYQPTKGRGGSSSSSSSSSSSTAGGGDDAATTAASNGGEASHADWDIGFYDAYLDTSEMRDKFIDLAVDRSRSKGKKEISEQRTAFKDLRDFFELGAVPAVTLSFRHQRVSFDSWAQLKQLAWARDHLGEGFNDHMLRNELLADVFGFALDASMTKPSLNSAQKRNVMSPNSAAAKARTQLRNSARSTRSLARSGGHLLEEE